MKMMGIKKKVDNLGRICIPKPMRELYGLGNVVELVVTNEGVLLRSASATDINQAPKGLSNKEFDE